TVTPSTSPWCPPAVATNSTYLPGIRFSNVTLPWRSVDDSPPPQPLNLDPLDSTIVTVTLKALPGQDYVANLSVIMEPEVNVKYYVKDAPNCASQPEGREFSQAVTAGNDQTVYVLVTNTKPEASATPELYFTPREPDVRILQPTGGTTFVEGNAVPFQAQTIGFQDSNVNVDWSYMDGPTQVIVGTSDPNQTIFEDHLCDGTYTFTATAYTGFETATDSVTFSVNNPNGDPPPQCAPSVEIVEPRAGATLQAGVNVTLRADYHDDHPESSTPLYNINWYAIGAGRRFLGSGEVISNQLEEGDSSIQVEYGTASDEISVTVQAPQPDNDPPSAEIRSPDDGANFRFDDEGAGTNGYPVEFTGRGTDPQDGTITDNRLTWYYRQEGTSEWTEFGQGANASHTFRYNSCYSQNFEILLEVVDSDGLSGSSDMITITIVPPYC
ncbi:MAG: hypothetical protein R3191_05450, partial [Anaerolineales bacterium]|nr:hypothetical protein [Anaerolineales bacterium]